MHAILGSSDACIATHPSDMCVALAILEAKVHVSGASGDRAIAFADFHRLPGDTPQRDTNLSVMTRAPLHRARAHTSRARHPAVAVLEENRLSTPMVAFRFPGG